MADIFISYASEDRTRVKPLVDLLEREGWSVWWDRELIPGSSFDVKIEQELDASRCVVVAWSKHSVESRWCRNEANEGLEREVLVPIALDDVRPPLAFRSLQTASLIDWPARHGDYEAFLSGIERCLRTSVEEPNSSTLSRPTKLERSVVVHPISDAGLDDSLKHLATNFRSAIANALGGYQDLRTTVSADGVYALHINILEQGESLAIRAELTRVADGKPIWADSYSRKATAVADRTDLARAIAQHVRFQLVRDHEYETIRRGSENPEAAEYFIAALRDNYHLNQGGETDIEFQLANIRKALELDPMLIKGYSLSALLYVSGVVPGVETREAEKCARQILDTAEEIEPENSDVLFVRGLIQMRFDLDYEAAEKTIRQAISLDPLASWAGWYHAALAQSHLHRGNLTEGIQHYRRSIRVYDSDARMYAEYARTLNMAAEHAEAVRAADAGLALVEQGIMRGVLLREKTLGHAKLRQTEEANAAAEEAVRSVGSEWRASLVATLAMVGRTEEAREAAKSLQAMPFRNYPVAVYAYVALGSHDEAFRWLREAIDARYGDLVHGIRCDPRYDEMRKDDRWDELMAYLEQHESAGRIRNREAQLD